MQRYEDNTKGLLMQWGSVVLERVANLPQPYRSHFEDWLGQQLGTMQLDPVALVRALGSLPPTYRSDLTASIEATLHVTEQFFGSKRLDSTDLGQIVMNS